MLLRLVKNSVAASVIILGGMMATSAEATNIFWTDWTSSSNTNGFQAQGVISTNTSTVNITYTNPQGIAFFQSGTNGDIDYWQNSPSGRNPATSPYTNTLVNNIPTGTDIITLQYAATQTLTFSEVIANPVFSYVSLNGNGYAFNQDFDILSFGDASNGNDCGYWGCGTSYKEIIDLGGGNFEYRLLGIGEAHGTIRFTGAFDSVSWKSLSSEYWNGFTFGIEGTEEEVFLSVPEPSATLAFFGLGLSAIVFYNKKQLS